MENFSDKIEKMLKAYREISKLTEPIRKLQEQFEAQNSTLHKAILPALELQNKIIIHT